MRAPGAGPCRAAAALAALAALLNGCGQEQPQGWAGYAEGEYVHVAAPIAGTLQTLSVRPGQQVSRGDPLFALEAESERAARAEAEARLAAAQAQAENATKGRRPDEVAVTASQLAQARAQAGLARSELQRQQSLQAQGFVSSARIDEARTALEQAESRVRELEAALRVARLPAREDERRAALAAAEAASQALRQSAWRQAQTQQRAPVDALVADTFYRVGETVPAAQPVVSLLPPEALKARFFVPQAEVATLAPGQRVSLSCDGCGAPILASISRIASEPEYSPPVIYSNAQRARLVFLVEAVPVQRSDARRLRPGQPLDVRRAEAAP